MRKIKRVVAITLLAVVMGLNMPQAFAGEVQTPGAASAGPQESPGIMSFIIYFLDGVLISD